MLPKWLRWTLALVFVLQAIGIAFASLAKLHVIRYPWGLGALPFLAGWIVWVGAICIDLTLMRRVKAPEPSRG